MGPMDILGGLLGGGKSQGGGGGLGGKILTELLKGGRRPAPASPTQSRSSSRGPRSGPVDIDRHARELEDLLGVAKDRHAGRSQTTSAGSSRPSSPPRQPSPQPRSPAGRTGGYSQEHSSGSIFPQPPQNPLGRRAPVSQDEEAVVLIRSMILAAKSDGRITRDEEQEIIGRIAEPTPEAIQFLRDEFARQITARDFAWSVPLGMEQKVYTISLAAIDLDSQAEATYLRELAHGLRLSPEFCNDLHRQYGAPTLY